MVRFLSTGDVANRFNVTVNTVKRWIAEGKLNAFVTPGGHYRVEIKEFKRFLDRYNPSSSTKKILLVDDDPIQLRMVEDALSAEGDYIVESSTDGYEALIKIGEFNPDLLITDIRMPNLNGLEVIKRVRNGQATKNTKIIVLTAYPEDLGRSKRLVQGVFTKPVDLNLLKERVRHVLNLVLK